MTPNLTARGTRDATTVCRNSLSDEGLSAAMSNRRKIVLGASFPRICDREICYAVVFLCLIATFGRSGAENARPAGICAMDGCNCTVKAHHWVFIKCVFSDHQNVELHEGIIPEDTMEIEISHCKELRIQTGAFSGGAQLKRVHVSGIYTVVANKQAFLNISAPNPLLEVSECNRVILESHAFKNTKGPLSVSISRCRYVTIKPNAFSWLLQISIREVPMLELSSNAFKFENPHHGRHGPATKILFQRVQIQELPTSVFPSLVAEIRMDDLWANVIRKEAFCATDILGITISNASIVEIESGAFCGRMLLHSLEFVDVRLSTVRSGAFRAGTNNLTIQYSRLSEVESEAIDVSVATVTLNNNEFQHLRKRSMVFHQWNSIAIENNLFERIDADAITATSDAMKSPELKFTGNRFYNVQPGSLKFVDDWGSPHADRITNNYFRETCNCNLETWVRETVGKNTSTPWLMESSFCTVDNLLRNCFHLPEEYLNMVNYTKTICSKESRINCTYSPNKPEPTASPPSIGPHSFPRDKGYFDVEISELDQLDREKRIIIIACIVAVLFVVIVILMSGILYVRRRGVCPKLTSGPLTNFTNSWFSPANGMTAATSARSISRLSIHEYAGLQAETRILEIETQPEFNEEDEDEEGAEGAYAFAENKATQTFPEELTEDYLKDLREKLTDPESYGYAKEMIEHLYDLVKVEESCNNNNDRVPRHDVDDDNAYDIIRPRLRIPRGGARTSVTIGTRVPSLEKLLPNSLRIRPPISEYAEPRDKRNVDQNHLYAELPGDETVPSTSRLSQPVLATLAGRAPLPLPPDVVNGHISNDNPHSRMLYSPDPASEDHESGDKGQHRLSFLTALGESIIAPSSNTNKHSNTLLCEYADPSDLTVHLYSEVSEPQNSTSTPSKMANRPLPTKPDLEASASIS